MANREIHAQNHRGPQNHRGHHWKSLAVLLLALLLLSVLSACTPSQAPDATPPVITVWYGDHQVFGRQGLAQKWVNILGNAADAESGIQRLTYRLNDGQPVELMLGPDRRRLAKPGDFNVELDSAVLKPGANQIVLEAANKQGQTVQATVTVEVDRQTPPLPYTIRWSEVSSLLDVAQPVDGHWQWDAQGVRAADVAYDRVLAIGDLAWGDLEVTVPAAIKAIDHSGYETKESGGAGFGVQIHWQGHTDDPIVCQWQKEPVQPHCGWRPVGSSNWYSFKRFRPKNPEPDRLSIFAQPSAQTQESSESTAIEFAEGRSYVFKARVETTPDGLRYRFKVWETSAAEPDGWILERLAGPENPAAGSVLLVAHHIDATWGDIVIDSIEADD